MKRDLAMLWIDARLAGSTMSGAPMPPSRPDAAPSAVVERVEDELHGEATRYRHALWACIGVALMPVALAILAWSGLYWLPVRILWTPFERGSYGLPWLSLYEWIAYLCLAAFFAYGFALHPQTSHGSTCRALRRLPTGSSLPMPSSASASPARSSRRNGGAPSSCCAPAVSSPTTRHCSTPPPEKGRAVSSDVPGIPGLESDAYAATGPESSAGP